MLQTIRDGSKGWITWFIVGLISLTFIIIGTGNYFSSPAESEIITKIEGIKITKRSVERRAKQILNQIPPENSKNLNLNAIKEQALKQIVDEAILVNLATKKGFVVSTQQVFNLLYSLPDLQENGVFSVDKYKMLLNHLGFTDLEFRKEIHNALLIEQLRQAFRQTSFSSPDTLNRALQFENQARDIDFVLIPNSLFTKEINVSQESLHAYYKKNLNQFMSKAAVKIEYLELNRAQESSEEVFAKKADDLIQLSYDHNDSLISASDKLSLTIKSLPNWIEEGSENADPFNHPKIVSAMFSEELLGKMNSEVIQIDENRYIVFRVTAHRKAEPKAFNLVKSEIETQLKSELASKKAKSVADEWVLAIKKGEPWKTGALAKKYNLNWQSVEGLTRAKNTLPLPLIEAVFSLPKPKNNKVLVKAVGLNEDYHSIFVLKNVQDFSVENEDAERKKQFQTQLGYYAAQLEFDLLVKAALKS